MFTLSDIRAEFDRLDAISGLCTKDIPIRISTRMTRALGVCRSRSTDGGKTAQIIDVAIADYLCRYGTEEEFYNTVRHEYAHAYNILTEGHHCGHDARWKAAAVRFGASPDRLADYHDLISRARKVGAIAERKPKRTSRRRTIHISKDAAGVFRQICHLAAQGVPAGEFLLGKVLIEGSLGVTAEPDTGWEWIERAARHGEPRALEWMKKKGDCV